MKYNFKQIVIKAIQLKTDNFDAVCDFMGETPIQKHNPNFGVDEHGNTNEPYLGVYIETSGGRRLANYGDYIVKGENGRFLICKPYNFDRTVMIGSGTKNVSDGYHTFKELYQYRLLYNAAFFNELSRSGKIRVCKSHKHSDGEECFGGGWFIVMAELPTGQISNHYEDKDWDLFNIPELDVAWKWDGHTPNEALERLKQYLQNSYNEQMNFGDAIKILNQGGAIRRKGWNGKGLFVIKQVPAHIESDIIPKMQSLPESAKDLILKSKGFIDCTSQCLIYNENTGHADSWVPSISDVFAEDWEVVY